MLESDMKRIFIIGYSDHKGGVETYIDNLTEALPQYDFVYSMPTMTVDGKVWHRPPNRHNYLKYRWFWYRFFKENHFDVLYFNTCDVVSIDMLKFAKQAGIPVRIIHSHSSSTQQAINQKLSLFHRLSEKHNRRVLDHYATHFFACSKIAGDWMFDGRPFTIIKNGISLSTYQFSEESHKGIRKILGLIDDDMLVGIIGRLSPQKNPLFTVEILNALLKKNTSAKAIFLGDGELRDQVESKLKEKALQDQVFLQGNVDNVNEWLSAMDILLMPSLFEGMPFVLVEAQANGLPCIVSSTVSAEADLTGLIQFVDLKESPDVWADRINQTQRTFRLNTSHILQKAGYSMEDTARRVSEILETGLKDKVVHHDVAQ